MEDSRQLLSNENCVKYKREGYQSRSVLYYVEQFYTMVRACTWAVFAVDCWFRFTPCRRLSI